MTCCTCTELTQDFAVCYVFLLNFTLFQIIYQRRQVERPSSLSYSQAPVKIGFILCMCFFMSEKLGRCHVVGLFHETDGY